MAGEEDVLSKALADLNSVSSSEFRLKQEQEVAVRALLDGKDVLAVLPTGFGKSPTTRCSFVPWTINWMARQQFCMIKDQISELKSLGYSAVAASDLSLREIRQCSFKVMFATAEKVKEKGLREILLDHNSPLHQKISAIVVDESHTVETWTGKRNMNSKRAKRGDAFREAYGELGVLRSLCKEGIPILALTGTADDTTQSTICSDLSLQANTCKLFISPNRPNIRVSVNKCEQEIKDFVQSEGCYRVAMYRPFDKNIKPVSPGHDCCSHCALECCGRCCSEKLPFEKSESKGQSVPALTRPVSNEDKSCLKEALTELVEGSCNNAFGAVSCHGFSSELVEDIINNCHIFFTVNDVFECLPVYSLDHCLKILEIIQEIYGDIPDFDDTSDILPLDGVEGGERRMEYFDDYFDLPDDNTDDLDYIEL
ncbi:ATP-dependent DNA helicase Q-like 4B [Acropora cervicornis]|uniref:ATP-dependent DNA helicase Q-like 4B n=1 Tax=Acropora cervicornis TaxID=6130 RepID=A0AAD9Q152_ACRCE|nr:ATP-dependent DNA helicase Q-like 4B [Acropora cervicornis]